jgi:putative PIN family toxin of toxin-antitoxin system
MIRVVLDTNIVVSAMLRSGGLPEAVFNLAVDRNVQLYISQPILAEYEEVLRRSRLNIHPDKVTHALAKIREAGLLVTPNTPVTAASDPETTFFSNAPKPPPLTIWRPETSGTSRTSGQAQKLLPRGSFLRSLPEPSRAAFERKSRLYNDGGVQLDATSPVHLLVRSLLLWLGLARLPLLGSVSRRFDQ